MAIGRLHDNSHRSGNQLAVGGSDIDHQILIAFTKADHAGSREHIEHQLLRCTGFKSG
ncbi:Uncharacterised protein [Vibrio cholerae]|nr:Uncharacterised protein [Vibrio cholerae]